MAELTKIQMMCQTKYTKEGVRNMLNRKPYRPYNLKKRAKAECYVTEGGFYKADVPVRYHQ